MNYFDKIHAAKVKKTTASKNTSKQKVKDGVKRAKKKTFSAFGSGSFSSFKKSNLKAIDNGERIDTKFRF